MSWNNHNRSSGAKPRPSQNTPKGKVELPLDVVELFESIRQNNIDNVRRLIAQGVEINIKDDKERAPIHLAAWHGYRELLEVLIRHKADVHSKAADGFTAVHFAALSGHADCISVIAERNKGVLNAKTLKGDKTALHIAASKGKEDVIKALIDSGCDQTAKNSSGQTAFELANASVQTFITNVNVQRAALKNKELPPPHVASVGGGATGAVFRVAVGSGGDIDDDDDDADSDRNNTGSGKKRKSMIEASSEGGAGSLLLTAEPSAEPSFSVESSSLEPLRAAKVGRVEYIGPMLPEHISIIDNADDVNQDK